MKILIIDDHPLFSDGLKLLISNIRDNVEIECLLSIESMDSLSSDFIPDLILLDLYLRTITSINAIRELKTKFEGVSVVVISSEESAQIIRSILSNGADGYIPKSSKPKILISALQLILSGGIYIPQESGIQLSGSGKPELKLTKRQQEVLALAIQGKANKVIALELNVAEGTVKAHLSAAFQILGVTNRTEAAISMRSAANFL